MVVAFFFLLWKKLNKKAIGPNTWPSHITWSQTTLTNGSPVPFSYHDMGPSLHGSFLTSSQAQRSLLPWSFSLSPSLCWACLYLWQLFTVSKEKKIKIIFLCEITFKIKCSPATLLVSILKPHPQQRHWNFYSVCTFPVVLFKKNKQIKNSTTPNKSSFLSFPSPSPFNILDKVYHLF